MRSVHLRKIANNKHVLDIYCGGTFVIGNSQTSYIGGFKFDMEVDIYTFLPSDLQKHLHEMMGNISVENVHFRKPKKSLAHGLMLLYEETYAIFLEIPKK